MTLKALCGDDTSTTRVEWNPPPVSSACNGFTTYVGDKACKVDLGLNLLSLETAKTANFTQLDERTKFQVAGLILVAFLISFACAVAQSRRNQKDSYTRVESTKEIVMNEIM